MFRLSIYTMKEMNIEYHPDVEAALQKVQHKIKHNRYRRILNSVKTVAAILAVPLAAISIFLYVSGSGHVPSPSLVEVHSTPGMTSSVQLPDGSSVWLNSNSTLRYPSSFGTGDRDVYLEGEAFFKVSRMEGRKFNVRTDCVTVEVLGTEFNVEAYKGQFNDVRTTLVNGKVNLHYKNVNGEEQCSPLLPGQMFTYDKTSSKGICAEVNSRTFSSWKDGCIVLDNTSLVDALRLVGNRFNVHFVINDDRLLPNRYTGTFTNQRLDVVLEYFKKTTDIRFEALSDGITYVVN